MSFLSGRKLPPPNHGVQHGNQNLQHNYFGPVTANLFAGGFERLQDVCFDPGALERDLDLGRFTGREELIGRIDQFIATRPRGYIVVQAEAGMGKSSLAAHLVWTRRWLHHFTRLPGGRSPEAARRSLAAQLIADWELVDWAPGGVLPATADRPDWFDKVLRAAAGHRDEREPGAPIVLVVDGLDEAEPEGRAGTGLPLGLPPSLPEGVFVVATSRYGIDRALHAVRNPADWLDIDVEGPGNLHDMRRFIYDITTPPSADNRLTAVLHGAAVDVDWFRRILAQRCAGVWIYLRYVLDEIRDGLRDPREVSLLPGDLAGYYAEQVDRWRGDPASPAEQDRWERLWLPLLGVLAAARAPLTAAELSSYAGVPVEATRSFLDVTVRPFLNLAGDPASRPRYSLRHQSLREMLSGTCPDSRPDILGLMGTATGQIRLAHRRIARALIAPGLVGERDWGASGAYVRDHLAAHAAAGDLLDDLVSDPGFLAIATPAAVLAWRSSLHTREGRKAFAAYELSLRAWASLDHRLRVETLAANAAKTQAGVLLTACTQSAVNEWPTRWAAWSGHGHRALVGHDGEVLAVAVGRAGDRDIIVSGGEDGTVRVWDAVTGTPDGGPLTGHRGGVISVAVAVGRAGDRDIIVSGARDGTVRVWDAQTRKPAGGPLTGHRTAVMAVAVGRAGDRDIIVSGSYNSLLVWDAQTRKPVGGPLAVHGGVVYSVAVGRAGDRDIIVCGSFGGMVRVWDAVTGEPDGLLAGLGLGPVMAVGRAAGRDIIVSGARDGSVLVWDAQTGEPNGPLAVHGGEVVAVVVGRAGDRDIIVSVGSDGTVMVWDAVTGTPAGGPLVGHDGEVLAVALGRAGDRDIIVSGARDGSVLVWDAQAWEPDGPLAGHGGVVSAVAVGRAGDRDIIVSGCHDRTVRVWDAQTGKPAGGPLAGHDGAVYSVAVGRAGDRDIIVSGSGDGTVRMWDAVTGAPAGGPLAGHGGVVSAVAVGRAGDRDIIVSGCHDRTVRVWDAQTGKPAGGPLAGHDGAVYSVAVGRAGDRDIIVSGSGDGTVRMWDAVTGAPAGGPLTGHDGWVTAVAVGRAGDRDIIVSGGDDGTVRMWDAVTGAPVGGPLTGHHDEVTAVAVGRARDRDIIVSGARDGTMWVWDAQSGKPAGGPLTGHDGWVTAVAVGRAGDCDIIVSGGKDRAVMLRTYQTPQAN